MNKSYIKSGVILISYTVLLVAVLLKIDLVIALFRNVMTILSPVLIGFVIAYILNAPYNFFERLYQKLWAYFLQKRKKKNKPKPKERRFRWSLLWALVTTYLMFLAILSGILSFLLPQLVSNIVSFAPVLRDYAGILGNYALDLLEFLQVNEQMMQRVTELLASFSVTVSKFAVDSIPYLYNFVVSFISNFMDVLIGFILSIYMLVAKKGILEFLKTFLRTYLPNFCERIFYVTGVVHETFTRFVSGQILEAGILGVLCCVGMLIFRFDYAFLISVIVAVTALIPIVGAFLGCIPGALILLLIDPIKALWFLVFIVVLQQLEGNLIYPKVMGTSVGLPGTWVMISLVIGSGIGGLAGVLFAVPTASVLYRLIGENLKKRQLMSKKI